MGMMTAIGIAGTEVSLEQQLAMHFSSNCYPPIPSKMIPVAKMAIFHYWEQDYHAMVELPEGVEFRNGATSIPASQVIESLRLDAWVMEDEEGEED
jgi:hypothetical protein